MLAPVSALSQLYCTVEYPASFPEPASVDVTGAATTSTLYPSSQGSFWALELNGSSSYSWPVN